MSLSGIFDTPQTPQAPIPSSNYKTSARSLKDILLGRSEIVQNDDAAYKPYLDAIASVETQGVPNAYTTRQFSGSPNLGHAIGRYRVTEGELQSYGPSIMGKPISVQEFASNPALQDSYMINKVKMLQKAGLTPAEIIGVHNKGMTGYATPGIAMQKAHAADQESNGYTGRALKTFLSSGGSNL